MWSDNNSVKVRSQASFWEKGPRMHMCHRYAHQNANSFVKWARASQDNLSEAKMAAFSYLSLREDGRTQISCEMIVSRGELFQRAMTMLPSISQGIHTETASLEDFAKQGPPRNPLALGFEVVQMCIGNSMRLGVKYPSPSPSTSHGREGLQDILMSPAVRTDSDKDWEMLTEYATSAPARSRVLQSPQAAGKAGKRMKASPAHSTDAGTPTTQGKSAAARSADAEDEGPLPHDHFPYPNNRLGSAVQRNASKINSLLASLMYSEWRSCLKEPTLRGTMRSIAGCSRELMSAESPALVAHNEGFAAKMDNMLKLCSANSALQKADETKSYIKFLSPTEDLGKAIAETFGNDHTLDCELLVLQARCCCGNLGSSGAFGTPTNMEPMIRR